MPAGKAISSWVGCTVASPLALEYRNSDGDFDIRHHVFRYDRASYEFVFRHGFEARRQANTTDETYFNLERFVNSGRRPYTQEWILLIGLLALQLAVPGITEVSLGVRFTYIAM
ncbi:hypothetical protein Tco_1272865 [Tanacetum coccineum]